MKKQTPAIVEIHPDFQTLVDQFILEGNARGVPVRIDNLIITYDGILDTETCGRCNSTDLNSQHQKTVRISPDITCRQTPPTN